MATIALIQNQVTMSYSSKTDVRPVLYKLGFNEEQVILYTAHNIEKLKDALSSELYKAVVITSNSLNDNAIKKELYSLEFKESFHKFLQQGNGCLVLHQARLAKEPSIEGAGDYRFLPGPLDAVKAVNRGGEAVQSGDFKVTNTSKSHPVFQVPEKVSLTALKQHCIDKRALYWHYLSDVEPTDWQVLMHDGSSEYPERPLLIAARESTKMKVIVTSLNLDWQKEEVLFKNLLFYITEDIPAAAVLTDPNITDISFDYLLAKLNSKQYKYEVFNTANSFNNLKRNIQAGIYQVIIAGPCSQENQERMDEFYTFLTPFINEGKVKFIGIETKNNQLKQFRISGRENFVSEMLYEIEMKIQYDLKRTGLIDGSFWLTVDSLKQLHKIGTLYTSFDYKTIEKLFTDRGGLLSPSYDGVVSPTTALLWLRAFYLGKEHPDTVGTVAWLKGVTVFEDIREEAQVYISFLELGIEKELMMEKLNLLLMNRPPGERLSEIDLLYFLKAAILIEDAELIADFIHQLLGKRNQENLWVDLSISATIINLFLEALSTLERLQHSLEELEERIEDAIFRTIIIFQNEIDYKSADDARNYLWENKANTALKCISAMISFEKHIDLPVTEIIDLLSHYNRHGKNESTDEAVSKLLEVYKHENNQLKDLKNGIQLQLLETVEQFDLQKSNQSKQEELLLESQTELVELKKKYKDAKEVIEKHADHSNGFIFSLTSWAAFCIVLTWSIFFFMGNGEALSSLLAFTILIEIS